MTRPSLERRSQVRREFVSRLNPELAEDAREVALDRPCSNEECLGDLAVGEALAGELGDPTFTGRERVEPREHNPARARTGGAELGLGVLGEGSGARAVGGVECLAEQFPRFSAAIAAPEQCTEVGERPRSLQPRVAALERVKGLMEQERSTVTACDDPGGTQGHTERARRAECAGEFEVLFGEPSCRCTVAERVMGERRLRPPGEITRAGDEPSRQAYANGQEVLEPFGDPSPCDP
jgi:hypothetical protein